MPNTAVKPLYAESTRVETLREDRELPVKPERASHLRCSFSLCRDIHMVYAYSIFVANLWTFSGRQIIIKTSFFIQAVYRNHYFYQKMEAAFDYKGEFI